MHVLVSLIVLFLVAVEFLAEEAVVVPFQFAFGRLPEELPLELREVFFLRSIGKLQVIVDRRLAKPGEDVGWGGKTLLPWRLGHQDRLGGALETDVWQSKSFLDYHRGRGALPFGLLGGSLKLAIVAMHDVARLESI
jgi:hypothetical protein